MGDTSHANAYGGNERDLCLPGGAPRHRTSAMYTVRVVEPAHGPERPLVFRVCASVACRNARLTSQPCEPVQPGDALLSSRRATVLRDRLASETRRLRCRTRTGERMTWRSESRPNLQAALCGPVYFTQVEPSALGGGDEKLASARARLFHESVRPESGRVAVAAGDYIGAAPLAVLLHSDGGMHSRARGVPRM